MSSDKIKGRLIIISGPSGVGKGTICKKLLEKNDNLALALSATTRPPAANEVHGRDYYFCTPEEFEAIKKRDGFLEWAEVHGNCYGTLKDNVEKILESGKDCILEIDVQGGLQVERLFPRQCTTIFVAPPSEEELLRRIRNRDRDKPEDIARRMLTAQWEMMQEEKYQHSVINDSLEETVDKILNIIEEDKSEDF